MTSFQHLPYWLRNAQGCWERLWKPSRSTHRVNQTQVLDKTCGEQWRWLPQKRLCEETLQWLQWTHRDPKGVTGQQDVAPVWTNHSHHGLLDYSFFVFSSTSFFLNTQANTNQKKQTNGHLQTMRTSSQQGTWNSWMSLATQWLKCWHRASQLTTQLTSRRGLRYHRDGSTTSQKLNSKLTRHTLTPTYQTVSSSGHHDQKQHW